MSLDDLLLRLVENLEVIGQDNEELLDSEVREQMGIAVMEGFVRQTSGYRLPDSFGLASERANRAVRSALKEYIESAAAEADAQGVADFRGRLAAFQNAAIRTKKSRSDYEEFFGHTPPEFYDENGVVLRTQ